MKKKILVVDDDQLILYGLHKALSQESVEVSTAATAGLAMKELSCAPYDLCLLDIHLPDCDGLELLKEIRKSYPAIRVIIMTASYLGNDELSVNIRRAAENGACHFMTKPFDLGEARETVQQALHEEGFHTGVWFANKPFEKKTRKLPRSPHVQELNLSMTIFGEGDLQRRHIDARSVNISSGGLSLVTTYPLRVGQIVSFGVELGQKTGIVVWSTMIENGSCQAGLRFA